MNINLLVILAICVVIIPVYFKTVRFDRFWGVLLFVLGFGALFLRLSLVSVYPLIGLYNPDRIVDSLLLLAIPSAVFIFFGMISGHFWRRFKRLKKLLLPYVLFGGLQQILFFLVFSDVIFYLSKSVFITFVLSFIYFVSFHLNWKSSTKRYWALLALFAFINTWIYVIWKNLLPQILIHGVVGSILFTDFTDTNQLKSRTGRG